MKKVKKLNALANAWQVAAYVGLMKRRFHVTFTYTATYVEVSVFGGETQDVDLIKLKSWISSHVEDFNENCIEHTSDGEVKWLRVTWNIKQD